MRRDPQNVWPTPRFVDGDVTVGVGGVGACEDGRENVALHHRDSDFSWHFQVSGMPLPGCA